MPGEDQMRHSLTMSPSSRWSCALVEYCDSDLWVPKMPSESFMRKCWGGVHTENPIQLLDACTYEIFTLILLTDFRIQISRSCFSFMALFPLLFSLARSFFAPRLELMAEILALRQ